MPNLRVIWDNRFFDAAVLTPSSEGATLPAVNVQDRLRKRVWRTTGCASEHLTANLGDPGESVVRPPVLALALINHNLTINGQIRVQAAATPDFAEPLLDLTFAGLPDLMGYGEGGYGMLGYGGVIPTPDRDFYTPDPIRVIYLLEDEVLLETVRPSEPPEAINYWKITLTDPDNPAGYLEVGRIFLAHFEEWGYHWEYPWEMGGEDASKTVYSQGGQAWTDRQPVRTTLRFAWDGFEDVDKYWSFWFFAKKMGLSQDWVLDSLPDSEELSSARWFTTLYGRFREIPQLSQEFQGRSETEISFIESL